MPDPSTESRLVSATRGRWLLVAAAVLWSTTSLFVKVEALRDIPGPTLAALRALFAAVCLVPFVRVSTVRWRVGLLPMATAFAAMNVLFLTAMTLTTAAAAVFLQYTATPWSFLLGLVILGETWRRGNVVAVGLAMAGIAIIIATTDDMNPPSSWFSSTRPPVAWCCCPGSPGTPRLFHSTSGCCWQPSGLSRCRSPTSCLPAA